MALDHELAGERDEVGVRDQLALRGKDAGIGLAEAPLGVVGERPELPARGGERPVQPVGAGGQRLGLVGHADLGRRQHVHGADGDAGAGADAGHHPRRVGGVPPGHRGCGLRRGVRRTLGGGLLASAQRRHRGADFGERPGLVVALGRDRHLVAAAQAELQQRDQVLGIRHPIAVAHLNAGRQRTGDLDPVGGGPCVQAGRVIDGPVEALAQVADRAGGGRPGGVLGQRCGDVRLAARGAELFEARLVLDQAGEAAQHRDVGVRLRGDGDHEMRGLAVVPRDAARDLEHGEPALPHEVAVVDHAVRDDDAVAEIGVRHSLPAQHAGAVGPVDAAGGGEQPGGLADRGLLARGSGGEAHQQAGPGARVCEGRRLREHGVLSSLSRSPRSMRRVRDVLCCSYENVFTAYVNLNPAPKCQFCLAGSGRRWQNRAMAMKTFPSR